MTQEKCVSGYMSKKVPNIIITEKKWKQPNCLSIVEWLNILHIQ